MYLRRGDLLLTLLLDLLEFTISRGLSLTLLLPFLNLFGDDSVSLLDELFHWGVGLFLLESLDNLGGVGNWSLVRLGVKLRVVITRGVVHLGIHHRLFALLEHPSSLGLILLVASHDLLELLIGVVYILNLGGIWGDEEPLVHVYDVNVKCGILLLEALGVVGSLIPGRKGTTIPSLSVFWGHSGPTMEIQANTWPGTVV
jgi:hypothetical protein